MTLRKGDKTLEEMMIAGTVSLAKTCGLISNVSDNRIRSFTSLLLLFNVGGISTKKK